MSNKLFKRKEFLIIIGGFTTFFTLFSMILWQEKNKKDKIEVSNSNNLKPIELEKKEQNIKTTDINKNPYDTVIEEVYRYKIGQIEFQFIKILGPTQDFKVGSPPKEINRLKNEEQQTVKIKNSFYISRWPITQEQWQAVMGDNPSTFRGQENLPVETVSWYDAENFCQKLTDKTRLTHRLPSEVEWEYACRAGTETPFYFGDDIDPSLANYDINYGYKTLSSAAKEKYKAKTTPVEEYPANKFGLQDMHGNVWEWCQDSWHDQYVKDQVDEKPYINQNDQNAVIRGGAWHSVPARCRSAAREFMPKKVKSNRIGFRVVLEES